MSSSSRPHDSAVDSVSAGDGSARYSLRDVLNVYPAIREDHLRYLSKWGLIQPHEVDGTPAYGFRDLVVIKQAHAEFKAGTPFRSILRSLAAAHGGQLSFDFRPTTDAQPAKVLALSRPVQHPRLDFGQATMPAPDQGDAARSFQEGFALDDGDPARQEGAMEAYRRTLLLDPGLTPALVNLANIHYAREHRIEAQALYERAIRLDPYCFEAHFNLGHVLHDWGRYAEALQAYRQAVGLAPTHAEAHFYLAVTLEKLGRSHEAKAHWRNYQQLAPHGEWVELAKEFGE